MMMPAPFWENGNWAVHRLHHQADMEHQSEEALLVPDTLAEDTTVRTDHNRSNPRPRSPFTHLAVLTTVLVPITLLPYIVARRNTSQLRRRLNEYAVIIARLQRDSKTNTLENRLRDDRFTGLLTEIRQESRNNNAEIRQGLEKLRNDTEHQKVAQATTDNVHRSELQQILEETRRTR
jgi:hypothetical protein